MQQDKCFDITSNVLCEKEYKPPHVDFMSLVFCIVVYLESENLKRNAIVQDLRAHAAQGKIFVAQG